MAKSLHCPSCKFPNFPEADVCLLCKLSLAGVEPSDSAAPEVEPAAAENAPATSSPEEEPASVYLVCAPFPAMALRPGRTYRIGRTSRADFPLPHHSISRDHGETGLNEEGQPYYRDKSSNGSLINGKRIHGRVVLRIGDLLQIGPYDIEISSQPEAEEDEGAGHTAELDFSSIMSGLLEETSIFEVLQTLEFNKKTGTLNLMSGRLRGQLVVNQGQPWFASFGDQRDAEAVLTMLMRTEGRYVFSPSVQPGTREIHTTITGLLLEASRQQDEHATHTDLPID